MNPIISKLLSPRRIEYLIFGTDLKIIEVSPTLSKFSDSPQHLLPGKDVRLAFPELTGSEEAILQLLQGEKASFEIEGIERSTDINSPLYISLYVFDYKEEISLEKRLILLGEDVTEVMLLRQSLVQRASEAELLLSALSASKDYINKVLEGMGDPLFVTNYVGVIKSVNLATQELFGYREEELIGKPIFQIIFGEDNVIDDSEDLTLNHSQDWSKFEKVCRSKTNTTIIFEFSCSPIQTETQGLYDLVYIGRDITERKRAEAETQKALQTERELNELKSNFIAMVSHEFRTPITTIISSVDLLRFYGKNYSDTEKLEYFQLIQEAAHAINHLIEDVLVLGRTDVGNIKFNPSPFNLIGFCQELIRELQLIDNKKHPIHFEKQADTQWVEMDRDLLRYILGNLLSNAIKYSPENTEVTLSVVCQNQEAIFEICDRGIGIPPENQPHLFDSFYRGKNVREISGTGLGLTIVEKAIKVHQGRIMFTSEVDKGTTFRVILPSNSSTD